MWFGGDGVEPTAVESRLASTVMSIFLGERLWLSLSEERTLIWLSSPVGESGTTCRASSRCRNERVHALVGASVAGTPDPTIGCELVPDEAVECSL